MNFQAAVTAITMVHLLRGSSLGWLDGIAQDVPTELLVETGGAGDDLHIRLKGGRTFEVQIKRGLHTGDRLWQPLLDLSSAIHRNEIDYGIVAVSPDSSNSIRRDMARDIIRLGERRTDNIGTLAKELSKRLDAIGLPVDAVCGKIRIVVIDALDVGGASIQGARAELANICAEAAQIGDAWNRLYRDAAERIAFRGARSASSLLGVLESAGIAIKKSTEEYPALLLSRLARWVFETNKTFPIFGVSPAPSIDDAWISLNAAVRSDRNSPADLAESLKQYHDWHARYPSRDQHTFDSVTLGRFVRHAVVVAGPGMGKTTLIKKLARVYSRDAFPVLRVSLAAVAKQMKEHGRAFSDALFSLGLDGSGVSAASVQSIGFADWVLLCDGLDESVGEQDAVAQGLLSFVAGHPRCRVIVTTRPIGYRTGLLGYWRHYELAPLSDSYGEQLGGLVASIVPEAHPLHADAYAIVRSQLETSGTKSLITRSPFLLGIAASLIIRGSGLGKTKTDLYSRIFVLAEDAAKSGKDTPPAGLTVLFRFIEILGWVVIQSPLELAPKILEQCAEKLAPELGLSLLQARELSEKCLIYWQAIGLVERVHHAGDEAITFIHKTLGEFSAARFFVSLPTDKQAKLLPTLVSDEDWWEVVAFSAFLGHATPVCERLLDRHVFGPHGVSIVERLLKILSESDQPPEANIRRNILDQAFKYIESPRRPWAYLLGELIIDVARRYPNEVGPLTAPLLSSKHAWTRIIGWTCALVCGRSYYELDAMLEQFAALPITIEHGITPHYGGGVSLGGGNFSLIQHFLLVAVQTILDECSPEIADNAIQPIVGNPNLFTVGSASKIASILSATGKSYSIDSSVLDQARMLTGDDYTAAQRIAYEQMFGSVAALASSNVQQRTDRIPTDPFRDLLYLSSFLRLTNYLSMPAYDVWTWSQDYDRDAAQEVIRGVASTIGIDKEALIRDASEALEYIRSLPNEGLFRIHDCLPDVDAPDIDWSNSLAAHLDVNKLERALYHSSRWLVPMAANLIFHNLNEAARQALAARLLADGKSLTLWAASAIVGDLENKSKAIELLNARLRQPLVPGCDYVFTALLDSKPPMTDGSLGSVENGLMNGTAKIAIAAADIALMWAPSRDERLLKLLILAYQHWQKQEEPYPTRGGTVPDSPREKLLLALLGIHDPENAELFEYATDTRSDVSKVGTDALMKRLSESIETRQQLIAQVSSGKLPTELLSRALRDKISFGGGEIRSILGLLDSADPRARWAAVGVLEISYLPGSEIKTYATRMTNDADLEVREAAFRALDEQLSAQQRLNS